MGQKLAERLIALQEQEVAALIKQETGKVLRAKGKKSHSHEPVRQSDMRITMTQKSGGATIHLTSNWE
jgi:hypothetical protein